MWCGIQIIISLDHVALEVFSNFNDYMYKKLKEPDKLHSFIAKITLCFFEIIKIEKNNFCAASLMLCQ